MYRSLLAIASLPLLLGAGQTMDEMLRSYPREKTAGGLMIRRPSDEMKMWTKEAEDRGLNCPVPHAIYDEGENALGVIWRLNCRSHNGSKDWNLRIVWRPGRRALLTPWPQN